VAAGLAARWLRWRFRDRGAGAGNSFVSVTADLYDPQSGASASVGSMVTFGRWRHIATLMPDGSVLVVGGNTGITELYVENVLPASSN